MRDADVQMKFDTGDMEILLGYIEGHGYALGRDANSQLVRVDMESDEVEVEDYTLDDAVDQACEWNYTELITECEKQLEKAEEINPQTGKPYNRREQIQRKEQEQEQAEKEQSEKKQNPKKQEKKGR